MDNEKSSRENNKKKCASWKKRTLLERYLILVCLALFIGFISLIGLHIFYRYTHRVPTKGICNSPACKREAGRILKNMDSSVNPCADFYNFACGSFMKYERVTDKRVHGLLEGEEYILRYSKDTIEEVDENMGPDFAKKVKKFYNSCLKKPSDTSEILMELLNKTKLWSFPVDGRTVTLEEVLASTVIFSGYGITPLFSISIYPNSLLISKGRSFIDWTKFLDTSDDNVRKRRAKYINLLTLTQFYSTIPSYNVGEESYEIVDFQTSLANVTSYARNESKVIIKVSQLEEICPKIKWTNLLKNIYDTFERSNDVENLGERNITVEKLGYLTDICQLIDVWGSQVLQNLLVWDFLAQALFYLDPSFHKSFSEVDPEKFVLLSYKHNPMKWKDCIKSLADDSFLEAGLNYLVIERMKPDKIMEEVKEYTNNIIEAMDRTFVKEDWLDDRSKEILRNQLKEMDERIGYNEESRDINLVEKQLKHVIVSDNYIENWLQNRKILFSSQFFEDLIAIKPDDRIPSPLLFGSFGGGRTITLPLGLLVPPVFVPDVPKYLNYGAIGFLIAHEMSHSFDYAPYFEMLDISPEDLFIFVKKSGCYVKQYSALPLNDNGVMVDAGMTIRDNIADNSGIIQAFSAYLDYAEREGQEEGLPGLNYTNRQIFFINYAQMWCEILESPAEIYKGDTHSLGKYRVREPLKNFPSFSQEFNCPIGSFMNPQHKCRLWG